MAENVDEQPTSSKKAKLCRTRSILSYFKLSVSKEVESSPITHHDRRGCSADEQVSGDSCLSSSDSEIEDETEQDIVESDDEPSSVDVSKPRTGDSVTIHLEPYQPKKTTYPTVSIGRQCRRFQDSWYSKWPWLEWNDEKECAFCHPCRMAVLLNLITFSKKAESAFTSEGFQNWKDATRGFRKHESSHAHKEAVMKWTHYTKSQSIAAQLSQQVSDDQAKAQTCLLKMISTLHFIA